MSIVEVFGGGEHVAEAEDAVERGSQLVAHRRQELVLEIVHLVEFQVDLGQLVDLAVEVDVDVLEFVLDGDQVPQHAVERVAEFLELVAGADFGSEFEVALCDGVADFLEVHHRLGDHVADDQVDGQDRQHDLDQFGGDHEGEDSVNRRAGAFQRHADLDHSDQVPDLQVASVFDRLVAIDARLLGDDPGVELVLAPLRGLLIFNFADDFQRLVGGLLEHPFQFTSRLVALWIDRSVGG